MVVRAIDWGDSVHQLSFYGPALTDGLPAAAAVVQKGGLNSQPQAGCLVGGAVWEEHVHGVLHTCLAGGQLENIGCAKGLGLVITQHYGNLLNGGLHLCSAGLKSLCPLQWCNSVPSGKCSLTEMQNVHRGACSHGSFWTTK